ncbi:MAG: hypothetical protein LW834_07985 [Cyanobium sp. 49614_E6]|jgi:hypothetical protein|nr:hypothetical protein [Cyanobium sp. 49614_E6]
MTATVPAQAIAPLKIDEATLERADLIRLSDLLDCEPIADAVIRSICIIRKVLLSSSLIHSEDQQLEAKLTAVYHALGVDNRNNAFERQQTRNEAMPLAPTPRPLPQALPQPVPAQPPSAAKLTIAQALAYATELVNDLRLVGERTISQDNLHAAIARLHLADDKQWHSTDRIASPGGGVLWHKAVAAAMDKLSADEAVWWSKKKNCWVITEDFDA